MRFHSLSTVLLVIAASGFPQRASIAASDSHYSQNAVQGQSNSAPMLPEAVRQAPLKTVDGKTIRLADFVGKVVVVNIWATWCGPCFLEMPQLSHMKKKYKSRGVIVLGLAMNYNENNDLNRVRDYLRQRKIKYESIWDDGTLAVALVEAVQGPQVIPQTFVIAKDGRIVKHFRGFNSASTPALQREAIEEALKSR